MALLGVAGGALWFAMPTGERQAFADPKPVETTEVAAAAKPVVAAGKTQSAEIAAVPAKATPATPGKTEPAEAAKPAATVTAAKVLRPVDEAAKSAIVAATRDAEPEQGDTDQELAYANPSETSGAGKATEKLAEKNPDGAETAAIPTPRPKAPAKQAGAEKADARNGQILRGVTMRSGPKKGASAIGTIPAKTSVEVLSCNQWCQVIYKGKRGWIYKSFVRTGG